MEVREVHYSDVFDLYRLFHDTYTSKMLGIKPKTFMQTLEYIRTYKPYVLVFIDRYTRKFIGYARVDKRQSLPSVSWAVTPDSRNQGYCTRIGAFVVKHVVNYAIADVFDDNLASIRVLERIGFRRLNISNSPCSHAYIYGFLGRNANDSIGNRNSGKFQRVDLQMVKR